MKDNQRRAMFAKNRLYRYKPEAKNLFSDKWSGFGNGMTFGERKLADKFISQRKKAKIYKYFRVKKIDVWKD